MSALAASAPSFCWERGRPRSSIRLPVYSNRLIALSIYRWTTMVASVILRLLLIQFRSQSFMGLINFLPKEEQYFDLFIQMTVYISDAARTLVEMLSDKDADYREYSQRIKGLEHACDELTHSVATRLNKSFITPFDREDIYLMSSALDDIVDLIDDAARAIVIFDVQKITPYARQFAGVIQKMSAELQEIV